MNSYEIKQKLNQRLLRPLTSHLLAFDNWEDPENFYTMTTRERRALLLRYESVAVDPTVQNTWVWFGAYDSKGYPRYNRLSIPAFLYQLFIEPHNKARIRGVLNKSKSDVNPYRYFKAVGMTTLELALSKAELNETTLSEVVTERQNSAYEKKVEAVIEEIKEYYLENSPTAEQLFMRNLLINNGHMPVAVDEAMTRYSNEYGIEFK